MLHAVKDCEMKLNGKLKLVGSLCASVLVLIQFQLGSAGFLHDHDDSEDDFHSFLSSGSNSPVYSVYSKHLDQPYFYSPPPTTAAPKPKIVPVPLYKSGGPGNPVVQYVFLQSNDYVRNLPFIPDTEAETEPEKTKKKNKKTKSKESKDEDTENDSMDDEKKESEADDAASSEPEGESGVDEMSPAKITRKTKTQKNSPRKNAPTSNRSGNLRSGSKNRETKPRNSKPKTRKPSSRSKPRSSSSTTRKSASKTVPKVNKVNTTSSTKASQRISSLKAADPEDIEEISPEVSNPKQNNSDMDSSEAFSPSSDNNNNNAPNSVRNELPSRESIDEAIKILSRVANQISQFSNSNSGSLGGNNGFGSGLFSRAQQIQAENGNFDNRNMFSGNPSGGNTNSPQYGAPVDSGNANFNFNQGGNSFSGNGNNNNQQYGAPQVQNFQNMNMFQQSAFQSQGQQQGQQPIRNTNQEAYGVPAAGSTQQRSQNQIRANEFSDFDTAATNIVPYQIIRNGDKKTDSSVVQPNFEIIKSISKMF